MGKNILDSPLTAEEQAFAEENYYLIKNYLNIRKLSFDEWYDIVIFRYLKSVRNYFTTPRLREYSFKTIAFYSMKSAISGEFKKAERRIKTFSLDEIIPNSDNFTYADTVTYENLRYINYETGDEDMNIKYNIELPKRVHNRHSYRAEEAFAIDEFLQDSDKENMCFEYETAKEAKGKMSTINYHRKNQNRSELYEHYRIKNCIYIKKTEKCKQILQSRSKANEKKK